MLDVRGGVTFADGCDEDPEYGICHRQAPGEPQHVFWFGFDCGHAPDLAPAHEARMQELARSIPALEGIARETVAFSAARPHWRPVYRTLAYVQGQCARLAAQLANDGIEVVNLRRTDWTGGLTTLFHRFGRLTFGWDAQHERMILDLLDMGIDAVYSDHVDRMMDAVRSRTS